MPNPRPTTAAEVVAHFHRALGGSIEVDGGLGRGAAFTIVLPLLVE